MDGESRVVRLNRLILGIKDPKMLGDHEDGDKTNNRRNNLRIASTHENSWNRRCDSSGSKSGFTGVTELQNGKFESTITYKNNLIRLGICNSKYDAAKIRLAAEIMVYGDYAPKRDDEHWNCDMVNKSDAVLSDKAVKLIESAMSGNNKSERLLNAPINNTSGCPGVSLWKKKNIWCVNFSLNGSRLKIGYRDNRMDAIRLRLDVEGYVKGVIGDIANEDEICEIYEKTVEQITDSIRKRLDALM